jgi:hypothetical protein
VPLQNVFPIPLKHLGLVCVSHSALREFSDTAAAAAPDIASPRATNFVKMAASTPIKIENLDFLSAFEELSATVEADVDESIRQAVHAVTSCLIGQVGDVLKFHPEVKETHQLARLRIE